MTAPEPTAVERTIAEAVRAHLEDLDVVCPLWHRDYEAGDVPCDEHQRVIDAMVQPLTQAVVAAIRNLPPEQVAQLIEGRVWRNSGAPPYIAPRERVVGPWIEVQR